MSERKWHVSISVLISLVTVSLLTATYTMPLVSSQQGENAFTVSPGEFTARDAPPMGEPYTISQVLVVWNRDNIERFFTIAARIPPENAVRPGYEPIPNENWVHPLPSSILIPENSYAEVQISLNIPRWENLTGKKWEVWIPVERQAIAPEIALEEIVRLKIETTEELPPLPGGINYLIFLAMGVAIAIVAAGVWIWSRRKGERKPKKGALSLRWR
jgi:hypothetical protein